VNGFGVKEINSEIGSKDSDQTSVLLKKSDGYKKNKRNDINR
jgi:hypothetical protein